MPYVNINRNNSDAPPEWTWVDDPAPVAAPAPSASPMQSGDAPGGGGQSSGGYSGFGADYGAGQDPNNPGFFYNPYSGVYERSPNIPGGGDGPTQGGVTLPASPSPPPPPPSPPASGGGGGGGSGGTGSGGGGGGGSGGTGEPPASGGGGGAGIPIIGSGKPMSEIYAASNVGKPVNMFGEIDQPLFNFLKKYGMYAEKGSQANNVFDIPVYPKAATQKGLFF